MKRTYNDIKTISKYIEKKQDVDYRRPLKSKKEDEFEKLENMRYLIKQKMSEFENNLLTKYKGYFKKQNSIYQKKIESSFSKIITLS